MAQLSGVSSWYWPNPGTEANVALQYILHLVKQLTCCDGISAQQVGFFNIGSGRVLDKIPGSGSSSGRVGVSKYTIGYFRVSFLLSGTSGYVGYFWGFLGFLTFNEG